MKINQIALRNFRRLESVAIDIEDGQTVFVGPNNSGKTTATAAFRCFLGNRDFSTHDFSVSAIPKIDKFFDDPEPLDFPFIELDMWFSLDPDKIEFGRAYSLLPRLSTEFDEVGMRLRYELSDRAKLLADFGAAYPLQKDGSRARTLSQFLGTDSNLKRHFQMTYSSLERDSGETKAQAIESDEAKRVLKELIRVDFIDAQRNIDDEEAHRANRLSGAFAAFYRKNLEQAESAEAAHVVIDENNRRLTDHYADHFGSLLGVIQGLGVPSANDRDLKLVSSLSPESALKGNTELIYVDAIRNHELPEMYNGLGFKNLIYMAIQVSHYHLQWMNTPVSKPLCHLIFIEEPEVHLHAQVQQTFISRIWNLVQKAAAKEGDPDSVPQLVVTTHSSHVLDTVDFAEVRYFRRCGLAGEEPEETTKLHASEVLNLKQFQPNPIELDEETIDTEVVLAFLKRYLRLTHCDLFFADAVILVEGTVEKLLIPKMIEQDANGLLNKYLTILEVGGAYAYRFAELLKFIKIPYLVITDLDSVKEGGRHEACRADTKNALTSNATLKRLLGVKTVSEVISLSPEQRVDKDADRFVATQSDVCVAWKGSELLMRPRTLEEAFVYENFASFGDGKLSLGKEIPDALEDAYETVYKRVKSSSFKKTEFALDALATTEAWVTPAYITEGLNWLEARLTVKQNKKD